MSTDALHTDDAFTRGRFVRALAGVAAIAGAILMIELALTRIFSVTMYYHFAFLAISIALFGLSASGVYVYRHAPHVRRALDGEPAHGAFAAVRRLHGRGARRSRAHPRRPQLLAREPHQDDRHLHARRPAVFLGRRRHLAGDHAPQESRQHRLWRRSHRRRSRLPVAAAPVESLRRAGCRASGRSARRRRRTCCFRRPRRCFARRRSPRWPWESPAACS